MTRKIKKNEEDHAGKLTASHFMERLKKLQSDVELKKIQRYFKSGEGQYGEGDHPWRKDGPIVFIGKRVY
jgi:hypothetical protein